MDIYPKLCLEKVTDIHIGLLKELNIKGLILDVDNTLIDYDRNLITDAVKWCKELQNLGISFCIASNSNNKEKVSAVADALNIPYVMFAMKPFSRGLFQAKCIIGLPFKNIAIVGDQLFTDIIGGNRLNMYSILVKPVGKKESILTKVKRPIENLLIKKHFKNR